MKTIRYHGLGLILLLAVSTIGAQSSANKLTFHEDGSFKLLVIADTHFGPSGDSLANVLIKNLIASEKPDLIIINGDVTTGDPGPRLQDLQQAIAQAGNLLASQKIPWAITFGNHDCETIQRYGITKADHMGYYEAYPYNVNAGWERGLSGVGEKYFLIWDAKGTAPVFNIWLLDSQSNSTVPDARYDWIRTDQVYWYYKTSKDLEARYGKKIPSLMFFHIPLPEIKEMVLNAKTIGVRHEPECPSNINSGLFAAVLDRGDVLGIFHGHDHLNNYVGKWKGIMMGYCAVAGYRGYPRMPKEDPSHDHIRGGRVFLLNDKDPTQFKTWIRFRDGSKSWESEEYMRQNLK